MFPVLRCICAVFLATSICASVPTARAATAVGLQPELSVRAGTLGIGPEFGVRLPGTAFGLRANLNIFSFNDDDLYSHRFVNNDPLTGYDVSARFSGSVRLLSGGLTLDYYPLGSGLRLSAGVYGNGNRVTANAIPAGTTRVGRTEYGTANAGSLSFKALVNDVSPYLGIGWSGLLTRHLLFSADVGVLVEGDPRVSVASSGPVTTLPAFTNELERQRERIQHDVAVPVYPVAMLGIGYRF